MAVLLLILVMLLHLWLGLWLLKPTEPPTEIKPLKVMEVALLASHTENPSPPLPPPPKPIPPQKPPVKKVAKKKIPVIKKVVELPKPEPVSEEMPSSLPSDLPVKPSTSEAKPVTTAVNKASTERTNAKTVVSGVVPLIRVQPKYPSRAVNRHIEGWVKIEFTISTSGTVTDAAVVAAEPAEIFDYEALKALKKWKFKEKIVNGVAVEQRAIQTLQFKLTQ
ncbi:MAG: energy transducer TonB [Methylococcaceae bacterium]|nr:energy transducer TonB [Methylococcaceae bacterium]